MKKSRNEDEWVKWFWKWFLISLLFIALFFTALTIGWLGFMPSFEELENPKSKLASEVISADQKALGSFYLENRSNIHYSELSPWLIKALIATEDFRFEQHSGIDGRALVRVALGLITGKN